MSKSKIFTILLIFLFMCFGTAYFLTGIAQVSSTETSKHMFQNVVGESIDNFLGIFKKQSNEGWQ